MRAARTSWRPSAWSQRQGGIVALGVVALTAVALPTGRGADVFGVGLVAGGVLALHALGLLLVHRANGIINVAQVQMGLMGGTLFAQLSTRRQFLVWLNDVCQACVPDAPPGSSAPGFAGPADQLSASQIDAQAATGWIVHANYVLSLLFSLGLVALVTFAVYHLVVKRFARSSRLVLTLVTIGLSGLFLQVASLSSGLFGAGDVRQAEPPPFDVDIAIGIVHFSLVDVLKILLPILMVVGIAVYTRAGNAGRALRAAADNPSRAETLGIPVSRVTGRVWVVAGLLSGVAAMLQASAVGIQPGESWSTLVRALAAAVIAGFSSLPLALGAGGLIGVLDQAVLRVWGGSHVADGALLLVILGALLLVGARRTRVDTEDAAWGAAKEIRPTPPELRGLPEVVAWRRRLITSGLVLALGTPWLLSPSQLTRVSVALIYALVALSLLVLTGWAGQVSLGQAAFAAVGAWIGASLGGPLLLRVLLAGASGALMAILVGLPALRMKGMQLAVVTLGLAVAVPAVLLSPSGWGSALPATIERPVVLGLDLADHRTFYYAVLVLLGAGVLAVVGMRRSRTARALIACRDNPSAAQSFGINLLFTRVSAFAISGFMAAIAGVLLSWATFGVQSSSYAPDVSVEIFLVAVLGGLGSVLGPLLGAAWFGITLVSDSQIVGYLTSLGLGMGVIIVLLFLPGGLGEALYAARDAFLRQVAVRHHIDVPSLSADRRTGDRSRRAPIVPKQRVGGGRAFVPFHYRLDGNWVVGTTVSNGGGDESSDREIHDLELDDVDLLDPAGREDPARA